MEDIGHFILRCPGVRGARRVGLLEELGGEGDGERLGRMLFTGGRVGEVRRMLGDIWRLRYCRLVRVRRERGGGTIGGSLLLGWSQAPTRVEERLLSPGPGAKQHRWAAQRGVP